MDGACRPLTCEHRPRALDARGLLDVGVKGEAGERGRELHERRRPQARDNIRHVDPAPAQRAEARRPHAEGEELVEEEASRIRGLGVAQEGEGGGDDASVGERAPRGPRDWVDRVRALAEQHEEGTGGLAGEDGVSAGGGGGGARGAVEAAGGKFTPHRGQGLECCCDTAQANEVGRLFRKLRVIAVAERVGEGLLP